LALLRSKLSHPLPKAIVLGADVNGLGVIRSLGRIGVSTGVIYAPVCTDKSFYSRYLISNCPVSTSSTDKEINLALETVRETLDCPKPVLIPTSDRFAQFLCKHRASLAKNFRLNCSSESLYATFLDKWQTSRICSENSVLAPPTFLPSSSDELHDLSARISYPVIVKPRYTFSPHFPGKNAVHTSPAELISFFEQFNVYRDAVIQEVIPSGDGDIIVIATYSDAEGKVLATYSGRKLRQYLPDFGATCFGVSERHPELESAVRTLLENIRYQGFAMIEFARSRKDQLSYFLELNTRTSWTNRLYADAGVDLTQIGYLNMIGLDYRQLVGPIRQRDGVVWLDLRRDLGSLKIKRRQGVLSSFGWFLSIFRTRSFAWWDWRDPMPFFRTLISDVGTRLRSLWNSA
jgi:predicted ATP-grasp superfamily ATP-dependent carboligase